MRSANSSPLALSDQSGEPLRCCIRLIFGMCLNESGQLRAVPVDRSQFRKWACIYGIGKRISHLRDQTDIGNCGRAAKTIFWPFNQSLSCLEAFNDPVRVPSLYGLIGLAERPAEISQ